MYGARSVQTLRVSVPLAVHVGGRAVASETIVSRVGANVVVVESALPDAGVALTLTSAYPGSPGSATLASHSCVSPERDAHSWSRRVDEGNLPAAAPDRVFVLDHLQQLQDQLSAFGDPVEIRIDDGSPASVNFFG